MNKNPSSSSGNEPVNRLVIIILADEQVSELSKKLIEKRFRVTVVTTSGGYFVSGTTCLLVGIHDTRHEELIHLIEVVCRTRRRFIPASGEMTFIEGLPPMMIEAQIGSASVYTLEVEHYEVF